MQLALPTDARYVSLMRNVADCVMTDFGVPTEASDDIKLAVTEACANAVRHSGSSSEYSVRLEVGTEACSVEIVDLGPGFVPGDVADPLDSDEESGRGVFLMRELVDDLQFIREDHATRVRLYKRWDGMPAREPETEGV